MERIPDPMGWESQQFRKLHDADRLVICYRARNIKVPAHQLDFISHPFQHIQLRAILIEI
jgi:hypothetical protein